MARPEASAVAPSSGPTVRAAPDNADRAPAPAAGPAPGRREVSLPAGIRSPLEDGDGRRWVYQVQDGLLRVVAIGLDGQEFGVGLLGAGEVFTAGGSEEGAPAVYLEAVHPTRCLGFPVDSLATDPEAAGRFVSSLARRVADLSAATASLALETAPQRLLRVLRQVALRHGARDGQGWKVRIRQQDLGLLAGLCRETVNAVLRDLAHQGLVRCGRASIWIREWRGLEAGHSAGRLASLERPG